MSNGTAGVIAAIALAIVAWFLGGRRKSDTDAMEKITSSAGEMIDQFRQEVHALRLEVGNLRKENADLRDTISRQAEQLDRQERIIRALEARLAAAGDDGR